MKVLARTAAPRLLALLLAAFAGISLAHADDDDAARLKELERALTAPAAGAPAAPAPRKVRTRAIVFDSEPEPSAPAAAPAKAAAPAAPADCAALPPETKMVGVDFPIQFKVGSAAVSPASEATLSQIARLLALSPDRCVLVEGHTDASGSADRNMALSLERANSVVDYIAEKNGIDRKRLVPLGKGSSDPIKNLDPRDAKNRRVVFKVVAG